MTNYAFHAFNMTVSSAAAAKSLDTPSHSMAFLCIYNFLNCRLLVKTSKLKNHTTVNKKHKNHNMFSIFDLF